MSTWEKKGIYHSQWRKASPITVMFTKGVLPSQYQSKQEGAQPKLPYAPFVVQGDDKSYTYQCENEACVEAIRNTPTGVWVTVVATGAKEDAELVITLPDGYEPPADTPGVQTAPQARGRSNGSRAVRGPDRPESVAEAYGEALRAAREVRVAYEEEFGEDLDAITKEIAASILINAERSNWTLPMRIIPPPDPDDPADVDMVDHITELLESRVVADQIAESINALVENGLSIGKAQKTIEYLEAQPSADEQGALPWDE